MWKKSFILSENLEVSLTSKSKIPKPKQVFFNSVFNDKCPIDYNMQLNGDFIPEKNVLYKIIVGIFT